MSAPIAWIGLSTLVLITSALAVWIWHRREVGIVTPVDAAGIADDAEAVALTQSLSPPSFEALTRQRDIALETAAARDDLLTTVSHDLRGPLNAILGWTQVLETRRDLAVDVQDALKVISRNARRQQQLLEDLVDMSRAAEDGVVLDRQPISLHGALDEVCQSARTEMTRRGLELDCHFETDTMISGDARRLRQAMRVLLAYAMRCTTRGGTIRVGASASADDVTIAISHNGAAIDAAFLPYLFEPLDRQPAVMPRGDASGGLGFALVRCIVAGHGGEVRADSPGGRGTAFTITLPTLESAVTRDDVRVVRPAAPRRQPLDGVRVLAVDDESDWGELVGRILRADGAEARVAASAAEALQIYDGWRPDVLLTDIAMPVTDGFGLLDAIRERAGATRVPAIAMTAHAGLRERTRTARAGFAAHLAKPIASRELIDAVLRVVSPGSIAGRGVSTG